MIALFSCSSRRRGFTMTELLVVIGIIAVLAGILLAAMGGVRRRAMQTQTESTMQEFSKACESFQLEHGRYPGAIPEEVLAGATGITLSGTENALLDLMGGYRVRSPFDTPNSPAWDDYNAFGGQAYSFPGNWSVKVDINRLGEGPVINGTPYAPYFTPSERQVAAAQGQVSGGACAQLGQGTVPCMPDLLDSWGQPIVYLRRARTSGPLFADGGPDNVPPQFFAGPAHPYTRSARLGEFARPQAGSILNASGDPIIENQCLAQIIRHTGFAAADDAFNGTARGAYVLISAGPDGVFFSVDDGPGTPNEPIGVGLDWSEFFDLGPAVISEFDDIRVFGGG